MVGGTSNRKNVFVPYSVWPWTGYYTKLSKSAAIFLRFDMVPRPFVQAMRSHSCADIIQPCHLQKEWLHVPVHHNILGRPGFETMAVRGFHQWTKTLTLKSYILLLSCYLVGFQINIKYFNQFLLGFPVLFSSDNQALYFTEK